MVVAGLGVIGLLQEGGGLVHGGLNLGPVVHHSLAPNPKEGALVKGAQLYLGIFQHLAVGGLVGAAA